MEFFMPRRNMFFEDPWMYQRRRHQQPKTTQQRKMDLGRHFLDEQEYYNPFFGGYYNDKEKSLGSCNCINCQMERSLNQEGRQEIVRRKTNQKRPPSQKRSINTRRNSLSDGSDSEYSQIAVQKNNESIMENEPIMKKDANEFESDMENSTTEMLCDDDKSNNCDNDKSSDEIKQDIPNLEMERKEDNEKIEEKNEGNDEKKDTANNEQIKMDSEKSKMEEVKRKMNLIEDIQNEVERLKVQVEEFSGNIRDKNFLYCEEMLTKCLIKLDEILANGEESIRKARKQVVNEINKSMEILENKLLQ